MAHSSDDSSRRPLSQDWVTLLGALLLLPALLGVVAYGVFEDPGGTDTSVESFGHSLIHFWQAGGGALVAGLIVFTFVLVRRHRLLPAVGLGVAGAGLAYAYWFIALLVVVLRNPGTFD